jgi:hypothetical protein
MSNATVNDLFDEVGERIWIFEFALPSCLSCGAPIEHPVANQTLSEIAALPHLEYAVFIVCSGCPHEGMYLTRMRERGEH